MNQCDGCRRKLPVDQHGTHFNPDGSYDRIGCTKERYYKGSVVVLVDYNGKAIESGVHVAFNLSGTVALGEVVSAVITNSHPVTWKPYVRHDYDIRVRNLRAHPNKDAGRISKLTNPLNLIVIDLTPDFWNSL